MMAVMSSSSSHPKDEFERRKSESSKRHKHNHHHNQIRHSKYEIETKEEGEILDEESQFSDPKYKYPIVDDAFGDRYDPGCGEVEPVRKRSRSGDDHVREKRSRSRSYAPDQRAKDDRHGSRDRDRDRDGDRERERRSSSGIQDREGSRDRKRERSSSDRHDKHDRDRSRERGKERGNDYRRHDGRVDRQGSRDLERNKERERSSSLSRHVRREERERSGSLGNQGCRVEREQCGKKVVGDGVMNMDIDKDREGAVDIGSENVDNQVVQSESGRPEDDDFELNASDLELQVDEEECDDILEKSRKLKEAIMKKHEQQLQKKQGEHHAESSSTEKNSSLANDKPIQQISLNERNRVSKICAVNHVVEDGNTASDRTLGTEIQRDVILKSEKSPSSFSDDMFGETPVAACKTSKGKSLLVDKSGINDNCDDSEGYYCFRIGELLDNRYEVIASHGKGMFSTVVRAKDHKAGNGEPEEVAIKFVRSNDTMLRSGRSEEKFLRKLADMDPEDRYHCVRFISSFMHRNHMCLVIESLSMNLRSVVKKFGREIGLNLKAVRGYARQLFIALKHLEDCDVLHCDIKPDNILVNEAKSALKLCDFGNATLNNDPTNDVTPYMVSRYYRAPEIMLGLKYHHPIDMWSVGCCLYELYAGKILFNGSSNKEMLRLHMELKGPFTKKMLKKGAFTGKYFDNDFNFIREDGAKPPNKPRNFSTIITGLGEEDRKLVSNFRDILEKIFVLDPDKRLTVTQALSHPFITC